MIEQKTARLAAMTTDVEMTDATTDLNKIKLGKIRFDGQPKNYNAWKTRISQKLRHANLFHFVEEENVVKPAEKEDWEKVQSNRATATMILTGSVADNLLSQISSIGDSPYC